MRNTVILNRFPLDKILYHQWFTQDDRVFLFSNRQATELGAPYEEAHFYDSYDSNENVMLDVIDLADRLPIDRIIALSEKDVLRAGHLRESLGVPGFDVETSLRFRDKVVMKEALQAQGVPIASYAPVNSVTDVLQFIKQNGMQIVIKPRRDAGSRGVTLLHGLHEIRAYLETSTHFSPNQAANWMVEVQVQGDMYHVDGIYCEGEHVVAFVSKYIGSCLDFTTSKSLGSVVVGRSDVQRAELVAVTTATLHALTGKTGTCLYHAELFVTPEGQVLVNEIACRIGGGKIYSTIQHVCSYDLIKEYVRTEIGFSAKPQPSEERFGGYLLIPPKRGKVLCVPAACELPGIIETECNIQEGQVLNPAFSSVDRMFACVVSGSDLRESVERLAGIERWFYENSEIEEVTEEHDTIPL